MPALRVKKTKSKRSFSYARLTPAVRNRIIGMKTAAADRGAIRDKACKTDGASPSLKAVDDILAHFAKDPEWDGGNSCAGGRPRLLTPQQEKSIEKISDAQCSFFILEVDQCLGCEPGDHPGWLLYTGGRPVRG
jgi:hypothetical protein